MTDNDSENPRKDPAAKKNAAKGAGAAKGTARKGSSKADRRARQAELERRRMEQEARDRKRQTIIGAIAVAIIVVAIVVVVAVVQHNRNKTKDMSETERLAYEQLQAVENKPKHATDTGGFVLTKNFDYRKIDDVPTFEDYFDPLCPGCGSVHRSLGETVEKLTLAGQINYEIHPNAFLDRLTDDQYCARAAAAIAYVADNDPSHVMDFIRGLYAEDFQPSESDYESVSDEQIRQVATDAGVDETVVEHCTDGLYLEWIEAVRQYTPQREITWNVDGDSKGSMTTPCMVINGRFWNLHELTSNDYSDMLLQALGLTADQVGTDAKSPIGADGVALIGMAYLTATDSATSDASGEPTDSPSEATGATASASASESASEDAEPEATGASSSAGASASASATASATASASASPSA